MPDRPFEGSRKASSESAMACERCVFGSGEHAGWCVASSNVIDWQGPARLALIDHLNHYPRYASIDPGKDSKVLRTYWRGGELVYAEDVMPK